MGVSGVYKRMPVIQVRFVTEKDTFFIQTDTSHNQSKSGVLKDNSLVEQIISFNTDNDMNNDTPTFSLVLAGLDMWDEILQPNDIVTIKINQGDGNQPVNDVIMVGMISEVKKIGNYSDSSIVYQITGQSMAKALMQLKLGTLQEIASITQGFGWMLNMGTKDQDGNDIKPDNAPKPTKKDTTSGVASTLYKMNFKDINGKSIKITQKTNIALFGKKKGVKDGEWVKITGYGYAKAHVVDNLNQFANINSVGAPGVVVGMATKSEADKYNKKYKKGVSVSVYDTKKRPDIIAKEKDAKENEKSEVTTDENGLMFSGKSAAEVVTNIMRWFFNLAGDDLSLTSDQNDTVIHYNYNGDRPTFGDWIELALDSRSEDEMLLDQVPLLSFMGSLRQLITQAQAKPYNEFYIDFSSDEKTVFNMRPTPFEPDDWKTLEGNAIVLQSTDVIEENLARNDNEVYSVFSSSIPTSITLNSVSDLSMYPVYFPKLAEQYGYSMLEQENDYIFRSKKLANTTGGSDSGDFINIGSGDAETNAKNIANAFKKAGASANGIAALLGNAQVESHMLPNSIQRGQKYNASTANSNVYGYAFGLWQWDGSRRVNLIKYANKHGKKWDDLGVQVSFLLSGEGGSPVKIAHDCLTSTDTIESITTKFNAQWEVSSGANAERISAAKQWYSKLNLSTVGSGKGSISTKGIGD